jgi:hypothetical protein
LTTNASALERLRAHALRHAGVEESVACKGTVIQSATFKVRGKAFLFLRPVQAMLKLGPSLPAAVGLAKKSPNSLRAGAGGWVTVPLPARAPVDLARLEAWIDESYSVSAEAPTKRASARTRAPKARAKRSKGARP